MTPSLGRIVHYIDQGVGGGQWVRAALVVGVYQTVGGVVRAANGPQDVATESLCDLMVFSDKG